MQVTRTSMFTQKVRTLEMDVTQEQFDNWKNGMLIQRAFPNLTISQREFLMTGAWDDEWDEAFPPELDDEGFIEGSTDKETFPDKLYAVDPSVNHAEEHDRNVTQQQLDEEEKNDYATTHLEDVDLSIKESMVETIMLVVGEREND